MFISFWRLLYISFFFFLNIYLRTIFLGDVFFKGSVEEQIKQDLKAVAEGVAASVLQYSMSLGPLSSAHHLTELGDQLSQGGDTFVDNSETQNQV